MRVIKINAVSFTGLFDVNITLGGINGIKIRQYLKTYTLISNISGDLSLILSYRKAL